MVAIYRDLLRDETRDKAAMSDDNPKDNTPTIPSVNLKSNLKSAIQSTNRALASLEDFVDINISAPVSKGLQQSAVYTAKAKKVYEHRLEYGPYLVAGSAVVVGGIMSLRRGKISGALAGLLSAGAAYTAVYETKTVENAIESAWPKKSW
jgi:hypothetical protein